MNWKFHSQIVIQGIAESPQVLQSIVQMKAVGVEVVAGVSGGHQVVSLEEIPIFDLVEEAIQAVGKIETSIIFASPYQVLDSSLEAIAAGIKQLIIITSNIPPLDTIKLLKIAQANNILILGPGSSGIIIPQKFCFGTLQPEYFNLGNIGIIGYGKALIYEVAWALNHVNIGQSIAVSLGQDKIIGSDLIQWLKILDRDDPTEVIVLIQLAQDIDYLGLELVAKNTNKPIICYLVGMQTPVDKVFRQGKDILKNHLSNSIPANDSYRKIITNMKKLGLILASNLAEIPQLIEQSLEKKRETRKRYEPADACPQMGVPSAKEGALKEEELGSRQEKKESNE